VAAAASKETEGSPDRPASSDDGRVNLDRNTSRFPDWIIRDIMGFKGLILEVELVGRKSQAGRFTVS